MQGNPEWTKIFRKVESLEEKIRAIQGVNNYGIMDLNDLFLFPNISFPLKFKTLKFEKHD